MIAFKRTIPFWMSLLLLLAISAQARDMSSLRIQLRQTGEQTAQVLNFRLSRTVAECPGAKPQFYCSGVLVRSMAAGNPATFWKLSAAAQQAGAERFLWLRDAAPKVAPQGKVGYVFLDGFSAIAQGKPYSAKHIEGGWEVAIDNWNDQAPAGVAIEAVYYNYAEPTALLRAHNAQRAFFDVTGEWLPVLRYARDEDGQVRFGFNSMEQLYYGYTVAARLNARYADISPNCPDGNPPYYCSGVLVRGTRAGDFHAWNPSDSSIKGNGVSFSWFRADQLISKTIIGQGLVMAPMSAPVAHPLTLRCIYPFNAGTSGAIDMCTFRGLCTPTKNTLEKWVAAYRTTPTTSCAIDPDVEGVKLNTAIRNDKRVVDPHGWNEWMIAAWPQDIGAKLPIEVFFHNILRAEGGLPEARFFQRDYLNTDSRYLPVLRFNPAAIDMNIFSYLPQDQSVD